MKINALAQDIDKVLKEQQPAGPSAELLLKRAVFSGSESTLVFKDQLFPWPSSSDLLIPLFSSVENINRIKQLHETAPDQTRNNCINLLAIIGGSKCKEVASLALNTATDMCVDAKDLLFLASCIKEHRGFGRMVKKILSEWLIEREPRDLLKEILLCKRISTSFSSGATQYISYRELFRRLYLKGTDALQSTCFDIIKNFKLEEGSFIPSRFLELSELNALNPDLPGVEELIISRAEGLPFSYEHYDDKIKQSDAFTAAMILADLIDPQFVKKNFSRLMNEGILSEGNYSRLVFLVKKWLSERLLSRTCILEMANVISEEKPLHGDLISLYNATITKEKRTASNGTSVAVILHGRFSWEEQTKMLLHAYDRARVMDTHLILAGNGVIVLDVKTFGPMELLKNVTVPNPELVGITLPAIAELVAQQQVAYNNIVCYHIQMGKEHQSLWYEKLTEYGLGRNPKVKAIAVESDLVEPTLLDTDSRFDFRTFNGFDIKTTYLIDALI